MKLLLNRRKKYGRIGRESVDCARVLPQLPAINLTQKTRFAVITGKRRLASNRSQNWGLTIGAHKIHERGKANARLIESLPANSPAYDLFD
jgi:hypothetical protein